MSRIDHLEPEFVEMMPAELQSGVIYVSIPYSLTAHLCACGCSEKVVLPLHPQQWRLTYDGKSISMSPSVGNIGVPCQSHYWIRNGRIDWSTTITAKQAERGFARDRADLARHDEPSPSQRRALLSRLRTRFLRKS